MECLNCKADIPDGNQFCEHCGAAAPILCPNCGATVRSDASFCGKCGNKLVSGASAAKAVTASPLPSHTRAPGTSSAERRRLTVMLCDLVDSTALASHLDPEDLREVIGVYHRCVADAVGRFDGFVAKYMGDGALAYFGYPQAHEDDAERAARAGLTLIETIRRLKAESQLHVRVGIATGLVVVGDLIGSGEAQERGIVGETPNLASRLETIAKPDTVVIETHTRELLGDLFEYHDLGAIGVKGYSNPIHGYQILRLSAVESRFEALHAAALTPLVGREEEIELLLRRWQRAKNGDGQVVLLSGESGIGKSRIIAAMPDVLQREPHIRLQRFCSPYHINSALYPVIRALERAAEFAPDDAPETKVNKLEALLAPTSPPTEDIRLLTELLSIPTGDRFQPLNLTPQGKKEKTFEALLRQLEGLTRQRPVLLVYEDVHWIDPTSCELLDLMIERVRRLRVLTLITFRPEFQPPWTDQPHITAMTLSPLGERDGATLVKHIVGNNAALAAELAEEIVERTDGVPLFLEELTKVVLEASAGGGDPAASLSTVLRPAHAVPATLHASLMARLDRLAPAAKEVAQMGAVIGREFAYELLLAAAGQRDAELQVALDQLTNAGLVFRRGMPPHARFLFKHALVQDAAYSTLLRGKRQELHARVAKALEERYPETLAAQPELLAQHFTEAGHIEAAIEYRRRAGELALARSTLVEAIAQLRLGLELIARLPDGPGRWQHELGLQVTLGRALNIAKGHAAPEAGLTYARARELAQRTDNTAQLFAALWGQYSFHLNRTELSLALEVAEELLRLAQHRHDIAAEITGHRIVGASSVSLGRTLAGRAHLEQALSLYDPPQHRSLVTQYGYDAQVVCASYLSWTLFALGYPEQALARSREAMSAAQELSHPYTTAHALHFRCQLSQFFRDRDGVRTQTGELISLCTEQKFPYWLALGTILQGWALANTNAGPMEAALEQMRRGLAAYWATGASHWSPYLLSLQAEAHRNAGEVGAALDGISEALERVRRTGERWYEAELHRRQGEVLLQMPAPDARKAAEACFQRALAVARAQTAKLYELCAATSIARLWRNEGKRAEARDLLAPIYAWFNEGFDTPDLREAKALLGELCE
jgi:class 3 adenylate cyclase/predicted ATPase